MTRLAVAFLCLFFALPAWAQEQPAEQPCLKLASYSDFDGATEIAVQLVIAYRHANICAEIVEMPIARAAQMLLAGRVDANVGRFKGYAVAHPTLVTEVPTPILEVDFLLLSRFDDDRTFDNRESIRNRNIGVRQGEIWPTAFVKSLGGNVVSANTHSNLIAMLGRNRIDAALIEDVVWQQISAQGGLDLTLVKANPPVGTVIVRHVLHRRHAALIGVLDAEISKMAAQGLFEHAFLNAAGEPAAPDRAINK